jgi:nicotinate-nucleotide adenylyltransferase
MSPPGGRAAVHRPVRRLGVLGGSFDPVHAGHLHVARAAQGAFGLDRVVFVPAARPPHKPGRVLASGEHRAAMLRLALAGRPDWSLDTLELERPGPSYTIDTLRALPERQDLAADGELFLLLGFDNLRGLEHWREAREVLLRARPIVVQRGPLDRGLLEHLRDALGTELARRIERGLLPVAPLEVSSTELRAALAAGQDPGEALPPGVLEYVRAHGLYGAPGGGAG